jgi:CDP-diacylglycerol--serine O-phosphatidyltransferase
MNLKRHLPNALTALNLISGSVGIIAVFNDDIFTAAVCIIIGAVFDFLDGFFARILKVQSPLGVQLDSLADLITFSLLPALLYFHLLSRLVDGYYPYFSLILVVASAFRLAKFNIDENQQYDFSGLPTPASAFLTAGLVFLYLENWESFQIFFSNANFIAVLIIVQTFMLNSGLRFISLKFYSTGWKGNEFRYILIITGVIFIVFLRLPGLFFVILSYVILSILYHFNNKLVV